MNLIKAFRDQSGAALFVLLVSFLVSLWVGGGSCFASQKGDRDLEAQSFSIPSGRYLGQNLDLRVSGQKITMTTQVNGRSSDVSLSLFEIKCAREPTGINNRCFQLRSSNEGDLTGKVQCYDTSNGSTMCRFSMQSDSADAIYTKSNPGLNYRLSEQSIIIHPDDVTQFQQILFQLDPLKPQMTDDIFLTMTKPYVPVKIAPRKFSIPYETFTHEELTVKIQRGKISITATINGKLRTVSLTLKKLEKKDCPIDRGLYNICYQVTHSEGADITGVVQCAQPRTHEQRCWFTLTNHANNAQFKKSSPLITFNDEDGKIHVTIQSFKKFSRILFQKDILPPQPDSLVFQPLEESLGTDYKSRQ